MRRIAFALFLLAALVATAAGAAETFRKSDLVIQTAAGGRFRFDVEVAETPRQREQGLMHRARMADEEGMLFLYPSEQSVSMWMKNTLISLDMLFVNPDGLIRNIQERAVPGSLATLSSTGPVLGVIELNGGLTRRLGIRPGDRVVHEAFRK